MKFWWQGGKSEAIKLQMWSNELFIPRGHSDPSKISWTIYPKSCPSQLCGIAYTARMRLDLMSWHVHSRFGKSYCQEQPVSIEDELYIVFEWERHEDPTMPRIAPASSMTGTWSMACFSKSWIHWEMLILGKTVIGAFNRTSPTVWLDNLNQVNEITNKTSVSKHTLDNGDVQTNIILRPLTSLQ